MDFEILKLLSPDGEPGTGEPEGKKEEPTGAENYLEKLEELKKTTVPKKDYESVVADNKKLVEALANGRTIEEQPQGPTKEEREARIKTLRNELYQEDCGLGNRAYMQKSLELRGHIIALGRRDPMLPPESIEGKDDAEKVQHFVEVAEECIKNSQSDEAFTALMQERTAQELMRPKRK